MWPLAIVLVTLGTAAVLIWPRRPIGGPPGPTPIPVIGTLAFASARTRDDLFDILISLPKKFGSVVGFFAGRVYCVYVEGLDAARRAMAHPAANGRATEFAQLQLSFGKKRGVIAAEGDRWARNSQFLLQTLDKMLQSGEIEEMLTDELTTLMKKLANRSSPVNISSIFRQPYVSLAWRIVTGDKLSSDQSMQLTELFQAEMTAFQNKWVNSALLCRLFPEKNGFSAVKRFRDELRKQFFVSLNNDVGKRTFIDEFRALHEATDYKNAKEVRWCAEEDEDLVMFLFDFLNAGCETINSFNEWVVLYLLRHPDQQDLLRREVNALGRPATAEDRSNLPRVQAFMAEVFRRSSLTPVGVPHRATEDFTIDGYRVPQNTVLRYGIIADHWSPELWPEPDQFRPERFLDENGQFKASGELSHFGIGPRVCTGRRLADVYNFLSLTHLLRSFELRLPEGYPHPPEVAVMGLARGCRPFRLVFKPR